MGEMMNQTRILPPPPLNLLSGALPIELSGIQIGLIVIALMRSGTTKGFWHMITSSQNSLQNKFYYIYLPFMLNSSINYHLIYKLTGIRMVTLNCPNWPLDHSRSYKCMNTDTGLLQRGRTELSSIFPMANLFCHLGEPCCQYLASRWE